MPVFSHPELGRCLFIHVPKAGGSSVFWGISNSGFHLDKIATDEMPHPLYVDYKEWGDFDYKFMVIREPLDRFCSMLRYRQSPKRGSITTVSANEFASDALDKAIATGYREGSSLSNMWQNLIPPQVDYYSEGVEIFKLEDGFETLEEKLGLDTKIGRVNVSNGTVTVDHLSHETISRIKEFYKEDYSTFGYDEC